jgi:ABC-2 type transport system permease protein
VTPSHAAVTAATARRVLSQLRHDPRTIGLLIGAPLLLNGLLAWILSGSPGVFDQWGPVLLGLFPLIIMFLITSVATLRERTGGTLERLMTMPMAKVDFIAGYMVAFGFVATVQALVVSAATFWLFGLSVQGSVVMVLVVAVLDALLGTALGLFVSAFANSEFQAVQFFPALLLPQLLLCGLIAPTDSLPTFLGWVSVLLPLTYAMNAMQQLTVHPGVPSEVWRDVAVLVAYVVGLLVVGSTTLRRRTP